MKPIVTEIFIEVEEIIRLKSARRKGNPAEETEANIKPVIGICPRCRQAIFEAAATELEGDLEI